MLDRCQNIDVDAACAQLRQLLADTRGLGRREFIKALSQTLAGSAILSLLPRLTAAAAAAEQPVTAFVFGGVWKNSAMAAFGEPFTKKTGIPVVYQDPYTFAKLRGSGFQPVCARPYDHISVDDAGNRDAHETCVDDGHGSQRDDCAPPEGKSTHDVFSPLLPDRGRR